MLYCPESEKLEELPTPESLKYRILISTKPPKEYLESEDDKRSSSRKSRISDNDDYDDSWSEEPSRNGSFKNNSFKSGSDRSDYDVDVDDCRQEKKSPSSPVYKRLIAIHAGKPKGKLKDALKVEKDIVRRLSLAEQALEKAIEKHGHDVVRIEARDSCNPTL